MLGNRRVLNQTQLCSFDSLSWRTWQVDFLFEIGFFLWKLKTPDEILKRFFFAQQKTGFFLNSYFSLLLYIYNNNNHIVAVKIIKTNGPVDEETLAAFRREVAIVSRVFSPHVCLYMGACTRDPNRLMLVTELMHTDVEKLLRDEQAKPLLTLYRRLLIAHDCALGLVSCRFDVFPLSFKCEREVPPLTILIN